MEQTLTRTSTVDVVHIHMKTYFVLISINFAYFAQLIAVVGSGFLAQSIQTALHGGTNESAWLSQAIAIMTVVLTPTTSQIADLWGRKWPLTVAMSCGCIGSIVASRAQTMGTAIAGFVVIGICFGAQPILHAVVSEVLPRRQRGLAQGCVNASAGTGAFVALCMGGTLLRYNNLQNFRIFLYVTAAIFFLAALGIAVFYNPPPREEQVTLTTTQKLRKMDWIGYLLFTPGLVLFCVALSWSRNPYPWSSPRIIGTFVVGVVLMIMFCIYEWRFTKVGILNHDLFRNKNFSVALLLIFVDGLAFFAANSYYAFEVSVFTGADLLISGMHFALVFIASAICALLSGAYTTKTRALRLPTFVGLALVLVFFICMATTTGSNPGGAFWAFAVILGIGNGILLPTVMVLAQLCTPPELISTASALMIANRSLGATIGLAINNALFNSALTTEIPKRIAAATLPLGLPPTSLGSLIGALTGHNPAALAQVPGASPSIIGAAGNALVRAYGIGFRNAWIASACFTVLAVIGCFWISDPKEEFTAHIDAPAEQRVAEKQARLEGVHMPSADSKSKEMQVELARV